MRRASADPDIAQLHELAAWPRQRPTRIEPGHGRHLAFDDVGAELDTDRVPVGVDRQRVVLAGHGDQDVVDRDRDLAQRLRRAAVQWAPLDLLQHEPAFGFEDLAKVARARRHPTGYTPQCVGVDGDRHASPRKRADTVVLARARRKQPIGTTTR